MAPEVSAPAGPTRRVLRLAFYASAAIPLLALCGTPPDPMLLIYTIFVAGCALRPRISVAPGRPRVLWPGYLLVMALVGFLTETLAWAGNYLARAEQPALLHPQLAYDLLLSPGIYLAWAAGWIVVTRRWRFSLAEVFVVQGVYGVFLEQQGAVFQAGLESMPAGLILWLYVFIVYGSAAGLAFLPFEGALASNQARRSALRFPVALVAQFAMTAVVALTWAAILGALGLVIPEPRPIWAAPFW